MNTSQGPLSRARHRLRLTIAAAGTVLAVAAAGIPLGAGIAAAEPAPSAEQLRQDPTGERAARLFAALARAGLTPPGSGT